MATLEKIRNKAGLLVIVVGIALFAFIIGDFLRSGSTFFHQSKEKVVIVNGNSVSIQDFQQQLEETTNLYKSRNNTSLSEEEQNQIRQSVFEGIVGTLLLDEVCDQIGFAVGKDELADMILGENISPMLLQMPDFQNPQTGVFDKNVLLQFLQTIETDDLSMLAPDMQQQILAAKNSWLNLEKNIIEQKKRSKLMTLIASAITANSIDAKAAYDENGVNVDFKFAYQPYNTIPDSLVVVTNDEVKKLYDLRKSAFKQEKAKVIDYIAVNILPSEADFDEVAKRMDEIKTEMRNDSTDIVALIEDNSELHFLDVYCSAGQLPNDEVRNFVAVSPKGAIEGPVLLNDNTYNLYKLIDTKQGPDSIRLNQLVLPPFAEEARLTAYADSLIKVVKSGKSFGELALEATSGQSNGDIGWQTETSLATGLDVKLMKVLFEAKLNEVFTIKSSYGTHLVQVVEKTKPVTKYKVGTVQIAVTPSSETYNKMYNKLNQYIARNSKLEAFKTVAIDSGYICQTNVPVYENQPTIASIANSRQVIRWAYNHKHGDISDIFECEDYFIVAAVEGTLKKGTQSFDGVSDFLKRELINRKKGELIVDNLKKQNFSSLDEYAQAMNSTPQEVKFVTFATQRITGIGTDPIVNARAVSAETGQITGPFAGKNAVYVISVLDKKTSEQAFDEKAQKKQLNEQNNYRLMSLIQNNYLLKENAKIEDNRIRFY